ncbi:LuxR C-terminal-related transcriptional regulator [Vibrio sonorensis]|uniref:LuxR C-terminal-related transcriptional regulator n=1 Tax=Vibrio sonorensis TaxID=1004316 RepID=UPI0008DAF9E4|nr:LuxR C-terminal-related transcriptional regulator [Vibrio sonorensis]
MGKNIYRRTIHFLSQDKSVVREDVDELQRLLRFTVPRIETEDLMMALQEHKHKILLFDYQEYKELVRQLDQLPLTNKIFETIVFNVDHRLTTCELLELGHLKGPFYRDDGIEGMIEDCQLIVQGQNRLPRNVMSQLIHYYRHNAHVPYTNSAVDLTSREIQILRCLRTGASNNQIADDLFISEYTVKSHLYQIFKKLSVKNRTQATAWANKHMMS